MADLNSLPLDEVEALCDKRMLDFFRDFYSDQPNEYRSALVRYVSKPKLPIKDLLDAIRTHAAPRDAWAETMTICRRVATGAPWDRLLAPDLDRDIKGAHHWLTTQLQRFPDACGIYLGLDTLNMRGGCGTNVEIGGTSECDPLTDYQDWLYWQLRYGDKHLIRGLYEMQQEYSRDAWRVRDEQVPCGDCSNFADYALFLSYSGIILGHAFKRLRVLGDATARMGISRRRHVFTRPKDTRRFYLPVRINKNTGELLPHCSPVIESSAVSARQCSD